MSLCVSCMGYKVVVGGCGFDLRGTETLATSALRKHEQSGAQFDGEQGAFGSRETHGEEGHACECGHGKRMDRLIGCPIRLL